MLLSKQSSLSSGTISESDEVGICCSVGCADEVFKDLTLENRAVIALAGLVEEAVETPIGPRAMQRVAVYLNGLNSQMVTTLVTTVLASRPRWLPLEYHWAPLDHDPLLYLLELLGGRLKSLTYVCHPLSREPLLQAISAMPALTTLCLPEAADDNALAVIGAACHALTSLCVRGSKCVTDDGVRRLLLRRHAYTRSRWRRLFSRWRNLRSSLVSRQQSRYRQLPSPIMDVTLLVPLDAEHLHPLSGTLTHLDLAGTKVSSQGVDWARNILLPQAFIDVSHPYQRSLRSQTSLEDQMARLLAPLTP